jgi:benzoate transport
MSNSTAVASGSDPRHTIASGRMGLLQIIVVAIAIGVTALDGFDVLSISFAAPGIRQEWHLPADGLGWVLSMELWGMALGSLLLGGIADKIGRRPTTLWCLLFMVTGMYMVTRAHSPVELSIWRVLTGLGIGGMLAAINAVTAEFANSRRKALCISLMAIGYPIGVVVGGRIVADLLGHDWRDVFYFGAAITAAFLPLVFFLMPESVHWLVQKQPARALEKVNRALTRMGHPQTDALPSIAVEHRGSIADIFAPAFIVTTLLLAVIYFFHVLTFYFLMKWISPFIVDMGFKPSDGGNIIVWANMGGATGGAVLGLLALRFPVKPMTIVLMVLSMVSVAVFGRVPADLTKLALFAALAGFCTNGAIVGMYAIFAHAYPTQVRASGTGFAIGIGRGGSALAPVLGGYLQVAGFGRPAIFIIMGCSALISAILLTFLKLQPEEKLKQATASGAPSLTGAST